MRSRLARRGTSTLRKAQRLQVVATYGPDCARCGQPGTEIDHIIELQDWPDDYTRDAEDIGNLQLLCHACHVIKTNAMRAKRNTANNGFFRNGLHPRPQSISFPSPSRVIRPPMRLEPTE